MAWFTGLNKITVNNSPFEHRLDIVCVCVCVYVCVLGRVQLFATPWTVARQAPLAT